jgi:lysophospholipase L1-like esterase
MRHVFVYGDSMSWGIVPGSRQRLPFDARWPGVLEGELEHQGLRARVTEDCLNGRRTVWEDPFKAGRNGRQGIEQRIEAQSPLDLVILLLGANDFQATHQNLAWHSAQGVGAVVGAIRQAPIEPGMRVPPILVVAPPPIGVPSGLMAEKFAGATEKGRGAADAYRRVAVETGCAFFDAGTVISASPVDGVHLDAEAHRRLGLALAPEVMVLFAEVAAATKGQGA